MAGATATTEKEPKTEAPDKAPKTDAAGAGGKSPVDDAERWPDRGERRRAYFAKVRKHRAVEPLLRRVFASISLDEVLGVLEAMDEVQEQS